MGKNNFKYLIRNRNDSTLYYPGIAISSSNVGTAILDKLPNFISELPNFISEDYEVIRSDNPLFEEVLRKELFGNHGNMGLESQIDHLEYQLAIKKKNKDLIIGALNFINSSKETPE